MNEILAPMTGHLAERVGEHAARVVARWSDGVRAIIACGQAIAEAKADLPHGAFTEMVERHLPFGRRTAQKLMAIAETFGQRIEEKRLSESLLPAAWTTLYDLAALPAPDFDGLLDHGDIRPELTRAELKLALSRLRQGALPAPPALDSLPAGKYRAILADPPWPFETWSDAGKDRSQEAHYDTMTIEAIAALPVAALAAPDCMLFLWAPWNLVPDARGVIDAWGFRYSTGGLVWFKEGNFGNGYYVRLDTEPCLLAVKGSPKRLNADVRQSIHAPRGAHSAKPREAYDRIERLSAGPYLELFARTSNGGGPPPGWDAWGKEAGHPPSTGERRR